MAKSQLDKEEELQHRFYQQLPTQDITDVLQFVNEQCHFTDEFTHIQPRYSKLPVNKQAAMTVIIAQAMNQGNFNMAEMSACCSYDILQDTLQSRVRLATLKSASNRLSNGISNMSIFPYYSLDETILYGGVDGQKFEVENPTLKARHSKKYFKKGKGVVAYTLLMNHIPLQVEIIGPHEHESYFVFDIWYNNTTDVSPDVVTGDMHCINKANFIIMTWFGGKLYPRFTDIEFQRKHLYSPKELSEYEEFLIQPIGQIDRKLIETEELHLRQIIVTLGLKEMSQSTLIKKIMYYEANPTRKLYLSLIS